MRKKVFLLSFSNPISVINMIFSAKRLIVSIFLVSAFFSGFLNNVFAESEENTDNSDQQILEFELSNFGDKGKRTWDVKAESADIFSNTVSLSNVTANAYGEEDNVNLVADFGTYDKIEGNVHLQDNVVIISEAGAKLVTDSLDWYQNEKRVVTEDDVHITKGSFKAVGKGIEAEPNLKKVRLNKDVKVDIKDTDFSLTAKEVEKSSSQEKQPVTITCDGPLDVDYEKQIAIFNGNVKVVHADGEMYADKMVVTFDSEGKTIEKVESYGNVKIVNEENTSHSSEAVYTASDKKVVLTGRPRLVIYSTGGFDASFGN